MKTKNEEDFDQNYTYDNSIKSAVFDVESQHGMFETYSPDIDHVLRLANHPLEKRRVWTMIDSNEGMYLIAGYHLVNRIYHVITNEAWIDEDEEYLIQEYSENDEEDEDEDEEPSDYEKELQREEEIYRIQGETK